MTLRKEEAVDGRKGAGAGLNYYPGIAVRVGSPRYI